MTADMIAAPFESVVICGLIPFVMKMPLSFP